MKYTKQQLTEMDERMVREGLIFFNQLKQMSHEKLLSIRSLSGYDGTDGHAIEIDSSMTVNQLAEEIVGYTQRHIKIDLLEDWINSNK